MTLWERVQQAGWDSESLQQNDVRNLAKGGNSHEFRGLSSRRGLLKIEWLLPGAAVSRLPWSEVKANSLGRVRIASTPLARSLWEGEPLAHGPPGQGLMWTKVPPAIGQEPCHQDFPSALSTVVTCPAFSGPYGHMLSVPWTLAIGPTFLWSYPLWSYRSCWGLYSRSMWPSASLDDWENRAEPTTLSVARLIIQNK